MSEKKAIIPNMFTMTNLVIGFIAIIFAGKGPEYLPLAGVLVFIASFFDLFDGAAARALKVDNPIGAELDSLADAISYGIAPGIISYHAFLKDLPELAMLIAPIFPLCAVYRLARFNIIQTDSKGFSGLPSPPAGMLISSIPALSYSLPFWGPINFKFPLEFLVSLYIFIALLMVSKVDYNKLFSDLYVKGKAVRVITILVVILLLIFFKMWAVFVVSLIYVLVGLLNYIIKLFRK